jgi:flagellar biosynthetic protein FliR
MTLDVPVRAILLGFLAVSVRLTGLMLFAPFFGSMSMAPRMKAGLVVAMSVLLYPVVSPTLPVGPLQAWPQMVLMELLIGAALGIATNLVFDAVQMAGQVLSVQMGFSLVNIIDPQTQVESTVMATLHQTIAMLIFLRLDVHLWLLEAMGRSFRVLPPGGGHISALFTLAAVRAAGMVFTLGLQMAAPAFSATLIADVVLALLGKASPHAPLMLLGAPVKILLGFAVLYAALKYWPSILERFFVMSMQLSERLLLLAR